MKNSKLERIFSRYNPENDSAPGAVTFHDYTLASELSDLAASVALLKSRIHTLEAAAAGLAIIGQHLATDAGAQLQQLANALAAALTGATKDTDPFIILGKLESRPMPEPGEEPNLYQEYKNRFRNPND